MLKNFCNNLITHLNHQRPVTMNVSLICIDRMETRATNHTNKTKRDIKQKCKTTFLNRRHLIK